MQSAGTVCLGTYLLADMWLLWVSGENQGVHLT